MTTFSTGGPGGQKQNTSNMGVRITHKKTGLSTENRDSSSQRQNKKRALEKMARLLAKHFSKKQEKKEQASEIIRTYNKHHNYVKDHRTGKKLSYKRTVGKGNISPFIG